MRPNTASARERRHHYELDNSQKARMTSASRSPGWSSRKSKRSKKMTDTSIYSATPVYSNALAKKSGQLSLFNQQIEHMKDEKTTIEDLISRIKLGKY